MSNPVITRLGVNQFWYKHWYSDTMHSEYLKQDKFITKLIRLYLDYGLTYKSNLFIHEYWYKPKYSQLRTGHTLDYTKSFRRFFYTNDTLGIEHSYLIRNKTPEYFPMKLWLFRYSGWFIVSIKWFKPRKTKRKRFRRTGVSYVTSVHRGFANGPMFRRVKLLTSFILLGLKSRKSDYTF